LPKQKEKHIYTDQQIDFKTYSMDNLKRIFYIFLLITVGNLVLFQTAQAVIPPDFIFNIGSQIVQVFSVVVVFLSTIFVTVYQFVKIKLKNLKVSKLFWVSSVIVILLIAGLSVEIYSLYRKNSVYADWVRSEQLRAANSTVGENNYFYDRIIVSALDGEKKQFLLTLEAARSQSGKSSYLHGYTATVLYEGQEYTSGDTFEAAVNSIQPHQLVTEYNWQSPNQLPVESGNISFKIQDKVISVSLTDLNGDFLVKNKLNYFRYVSAGKAHIIFDGLAMDGHVMVDKVLSNDKRVPTLDGYSPKRTTHSIALWNEEGQFFHFDLSDVVEKNDLYQSHQWILFKNGSSGGAQKFYKATLKFASSGVKPKWNITVPQMNSAEFAFEADQVMANSDGFVSEVSGYMVKDNVRQAVHGYALYENIK
jgi:hypothetical protein